MAFIFPIFIIGIIGSEIFLHLPFNKAVNSMISTLHKALSVITSPKISDHWKERVLLNYSLTILWGTLKLASFLVLIVAPIGLLALLNGNAFLFLMSPLGIAVFSIFSCFYILMRIKLQKSEYGTASQVLHYLALDNSFICEASFDIEQATCKINPSLAVDKKHVFIAGLARAGTTLIMRRFYSSDKFVSLTYRDMPFVLMPRLWNRISSLSYKQAAKQERAHSDGLLVDYNSPEALEEVFWRTYAGNNYIKSDKLIPMTVEDEVIDKFRSYVASILTVESQDKDKCYLSKNNNTNHNSNCSSSQTGA